MLFLMLSLHGVLACSADVPASMLAHRAWVFTETIFDRHVEPPARQAMLLAGAKGMLQEAKCPLPDDLVRQVSRIASEEQLAQFLQEIWPTDQAAAKLESAFLKALGESVPGQAQLLSAEELKALGQISGNRYEGTGIQIKIHPEEQLTQIVVPFPGGPARKAGARVGDLIVEVDGVSMKGRSIREVVDRIKGDAGTPVTFTVRQPDSTETRVLKMVRNVVPFDMVVGYRRTGEESWEYRPDPALPVGYLRVTSFTSATAHDLRKAERKLLDAGIRALVLDLRQLRGGLLEHVGQVADELLDGGVLWQTNDGRGHVQVLRANRDCLFRDLPLLVLIDGTAKGTPALLAAALKEHRHAVVIGEPVEGNAWVTSLVELPEKLGTANIRTGVAERPNGERHWRVEPDHRAALTQKQREELADWQRAQESPEVRQDLKPPVDPQLAQALEVAGKVLASQQKSNRAKDGTE